MSAEKLPEMEARAAAACMKREAKEEAYLRMSAEQLADLSDRELGEAVLLRIDRAGRAWVTAASAVLRHLDAVDVLDGEISNGGFDQYFCNQGATSIDDAVEGLHAMNAETQAAVAARAAELFRSKQSAGEPHVRRGRDHDFDVLDEGCFASAKSRRGSVTAEPFARYLREHLHEAVRELAAAQ